jgi:hypothetical protein
MNSNPHHITVGGDTWCQWTGCQAGLDINRKVGDVTCQHRSKASAMRGAQALRPHFKRGAVKVVTGICEHA